MGELTAWHKKHHCHDDAHGEPSAEAGVAVGVSQSQTAAYEDVNQEQQSIFDKDREYENANDHGGGGYKEKWLRVLHSPVAAWHKVQKFGVDALGAGALYGTGEYKHHKHYDNNDLFD